MNSLHVSTKNYPKGNKHSSRIPVIVVDLQTNKSIKYISISLAARALAAKTNTIRRKFHNKQPYLERYLIKFDYGKYYNIYFNWVDYFSIKFLFSYYTIIFYLLLLNFALF